MHLHALATAVPAARFTQPECWEIAKKSDVRSRLNRRSTLTLQAILRGDSGVQARHFALPEMERIFDRTPDELNEGFRQEAPRLAGRALAAALDEAGLNARDLDALLVCTCTGYLCPGVSSYVSEQLGLRADAYLQDLVGLGCGAAIPTLRSALALLATKPDAVVAAVAVEICSAAFFLDDDPGVLVSACLFGDGAAATIWKNSPGLRGVRCGSFSTRHFPADRDKIRFEQRDGKLRNLLHASVPELAASAVSQLYTAETEGAAGTPIARIISHPGGRDVIDAIERTLPQHRLAATRDVLREYGNMSSPSVLFALEHALRESRPQPGQDWWLVSFGAGFSAHGCRVMADQTSLR